MNRVQNRQRQRLGTVALTLALVALGAHPADASPAGPTAGPGPSATPPPSRYTYSVASTVPIGSAGALAVDGPSGTAYVSSTAHGRPVASVVDLVRREVVGAVDGAAGLALVVDSTRQRLLATSDRGYVVYSTATRRPVVTSPALPGYENLRGEAALDSTTGTGFLTASSIPHLDSTFVVPIDSRRGSTDDNGSFGAQGCGGDVGVDAVRRQVFLATDLALTRQRIGSEGDGDGVLLGSPTDRFPCVGTNVHLAVDTGSGVVWVSGGGRLFAVDGSTMRVLRTLDVSADALAVDDANHTVYALTVDGLTVIDPSTERIGPTVQLPRPAEHLSVDSVHHLAVVTDDVGVTVVAQRLRATRLTVSGGDRQSAHPTDRFLAPLSVSVTGIGAVPAVGVPVDFRIVGGPGAFETGGAESTGVTGPDGSASSQPVIAGVSTGQVSIRASAAGVASVAFRLTVSPRPVPTTGYTNTTSGGSGQLLALGPDDGPPTALFGSLSTASGAPLAFRRLKIDVTAHAYLDPHDAVRPDQVFTDAAGAFTTPGVLAGPGDYGPVLVTVVGDAVDAGGWLLSNPDPDRTRADLSVAISGPQHLSIGQRSTLRITVTNHGASGLLAGDLYSGVSVPAGLELGAAPRGVVFAVGQIAVVDPGPVASGVSRSFSIPVTGRRAGVARVVTGVVAGVVDPDLHNNGASLSVPVG